MSLRRGLAVLLAGAACAAGAAAACGGGNKPGQLGTSDSGPPVDGGGHDGISGDGGGGGDTSPGSDAPHVGEGGAEGGLDATSEVTGPEDVTTELVALGPDGGPLCNPTASWGTPVSVLTTGSADSTIFGGVTPDELTIAWTSSAGGVVTAWYADRATSTAPFGTPQSLASSVGALALDRVTLSGDGLRIGAVASGALSFVGATRASRSVAFGTPDTEFQGLGGGEAPPTLASPLLSGDDSELFYLITGQSSDFVIHDATGGLPWKGGVELSAPQLSRSATSYRRPSGVSLDGLTLFYWDEVSSTEKMAIRPVASQPFNQFVDIGARANASPAASCQRIYYATPAAAGAITIVYADAIPSVAD
jgi:hypothetical protein